MSVTVICLLATASCAAFLLTLSRVIGWPMIMRHSALVDVSFSALLAYLFYGTLTGMLVAVLGGLFMAVVLTLINASVTASQRLKPASTVEIEEDWCPGGTAGSL